MASPPFFRSASVTSRIPSSSVFTFGSNGMISYATLALQCRAASSHSAAYSSIRRSSSHGVSGMLPTLMWCASKAAAVSNS